MCCDEKIAVGTTAGRREEKACVMRIIKLPTLRNGHFTSETAVRRLKKPNRHLDLDTEASSHHS
jgi:hypothetical protein